MHAIILSAGRGSRLLPLTTDLPKCLLPVGLSSVLNLQLDTLFRHGIKTATVVTGFNAHLESKRFITPFTKSQTIWPHAGWRVNL